MFIRRFVKEGRRYYSNHENLKIPTTNKYLPLINESIINEAIINEAQINEARINEARINDSLTKELQNINDKLFTIQTIQSFQKEKFETIQSFQKEKFEKIHKDTNDIYNYIDRIDTVQKWTAFMVLMTYMYSKH
jgi:hypothetical protein